MKKLLTVSVLSLLAVSLFQLPAAKNVGNENFVGFQEYAQDKLNEGEVHLTRKSIVIGNDSAVDVSPIYVQTAAYDDENGSYSLLRFAVAVKGSIDSISFVRGGVYGREETSIKEVDTLYKGISAAGATYYYDGEEGTFSTDESLAGEYLWACYTIQYSAGSSYEYTNMPISVLVNEDYNAERKVSYAEVKHGVHEHDYSVRGHNDLKHYNICSLCSTIDETTYENHEYSVSINEEYAAGSAFSLTAEDIASHVSLECGCEITPEVKVTNVPEAIRFGEILSLDINGTQKDVRLSVKEDFATGEFSSNWVVNSKIKTTFVNGFLKLERGSQSDASFMTLDDFVAPEGDFEMEFEVRAAGSSTLNQSDITIRKQGAYEISLVFESKDKSTTTISSEYTKQDANTPKAEVKSNTFYTYKMCIHQGEEGYTYDVYVKNGEVFELVLENLSARSTSNKDLLKIGIDDKNHAGTTNNLLFSIKYLTLR